VEIVDSFWQVFTTLLLFIWDTVDFLAATQCFSYIKSKCFWAYYLFRAIAILLISYVVSFLASPSMIQLPQGPGSGLCNAIIMSAVGVATLQNFIIRIGKEKFDLEGKFSLMRTSAISDATGLSLKKARRDEYRAATDLIRKLDLNELKREKRSWLELNYDPQTAHDKFNEYVTFYGQLQEDEQKRGFAIRLVQEAGVDHAKKLIGTK